MNRTASITRNTKETRITVSVNLDGDGRCTFKTGLPFLEHMLEQVARHGLIDISIEAKGDLHIDARRYGHAYVPLDEALSRVVVDFSGRSGLEYHVEFPRARVGEFDVDLLHEFFQGFTNHAQVTLHVDSLRGKNAHHVAETVFKAFGRALRAAIERDPRTGDVVPSTKGSL
ncbi:MAG: imidazoleglycerol-phosphate dehydratase [Gammaproteobacteria bacterium]|nr:imidazoleglycerol-phosphate dehydratase [Gammaproteobacteria bacterium]